MELANISSIQLIDPDLNERNDVSDLNYQTKVVPEPETITEDKQLNGSVKKRRIARRRGTVPANFAQTSVIESQELKDAYLGLDKEAGLRLSSQPSDSILDSPDTLMKRKRLSLNTSNHGRNLSI